MHHAPLPTAIAPRAIDLVEEILNEIVGPS
eukprot:SAG11_NODE_19852_length_457_cov_1.438547_1_plen_29_part_10